MSNNKTTLVIMAAGLGTRYGEGKIKQLDPIGPNGEIIMDYSIYDAKAAGFDKVVFIIRKDIKSAFDEMIGKRIGEYIQTEYVFQSVDDIPQRFKPVGRTKPWGTAHAVLACLGTVKEPFVVINADDVYGREAYAKMHEFLQNQTSKDDIIHLAMPAFKISNTLSKSGTVTRGICTADESSKLVSIVETYGIERNPDGSITALTAKGAQTKQTLDKYSRTSMNMWACPARFIDVLENCFENFLEKNAHDSNAEFLLPSVIGELIKRGIADCKILETSDKWFGMTSAEDKIAAQQAVKEEIEKGIYPHNLWGGKPYHLN